MTVAPWPRDDAKLDRVRALLADRELDGLVVRAPDNVLYLSNYWPIKGYDAVVFPREGDPVLLVVEPQLATAQRTAWTPDVRPFRFYDERDPRPPTMRALDLAAAVVGELGLERVGLELSLGTQATDRMVGEPTTYTRGFFDAFPDAVDGTPLLAEARAIKTGQELERMRLANDLCADAMEHVAGLVRPGMRAAELGARWEGYVHEAGIGYRGRVEYARGFSLVWCGPGIKTFTATGEGEVREGEPTLFEIWVCVDGYWCDHTKNLVVGDLAPRYDELLELLLSVFDAAVGHCVDGASLPELDRLVRRGLADGGYPGQPSHPIAHGVGARAHEPPWAHQAGEGALREGMVLAIEPGAYWEGGGGLRVEDNFLIGKGGNEKLCRFPDDFRGLS